MAKRFLFVCLGVLALAVTYHLGAGEFEELQCPKASGAFD
jgi:hypothetical protein